MKKKLKNFLLDQHYLSVEILKRINVISFKLGFPFVLIGAQVRDLILNGQYKLSPGTTTKDIDLAIMIESWTDFNSIREELIKIGFKKIKGIEHRFFYKNLYPIDIVPFGKIEKNGKIAWPPDNDPVMNVIGFKEMYIHSEEIDIDIELAGAQLLGRDISRIAERNTRQNLLLILEEELEGENDLLIQTILPKFLSNYERAREMLLNFKKGISMVDSE